MAQVDNANFDEILTTTFNKHRAKFVDQVFGARPLTFFLMQAGQIRMVDGGAKIVEPLIVANNASFEFYTGSGPLTPSNYTGNEFSAAEYNWKTAAISVSIDGIDEAKNAGTPRILDLLEGKIMVARETITEQFNQQFHDTTFTAPASGEFNNLHHLIGHNNTDTENLGAQTTDTAAGGSVGGIDPDADAAGQDGHTYWQSKVDTATGTLTTAKMTNAYNSASVGNDQPTFIMTTQDLYEKYESLLQPQLRYSDPVTADAGFQNLMFKGAPVLYDADNASGVVYYINAKYLKLIGHSQKWFTPSPFIRTTTADSRTAQIFCYGELIVNNRARQAVQHAATV